MSKRQLCGFGGPGVTTSGYMVSVLGSKNGLELYNDEYSKNLCIMFMYYVCE